MTYRGEVRNGVVVLEPGAKLGEGTVVRVEADESATAFRRGSKEALLDWRTHWAEPDDEWDRLLQEVQEMREADLTPDER